MRLYSEDSPLVSIGEDGCYQCNSEVNKSSEVWFNLFNNMWGTNFPQWNEGDFTFNYIISTNKDKPKFENMPIISDKAHLFDALARLPMGIELVGIDCFEGKIIAQLRNTYDKQVGIYSPFKCKVFGEVDAFGNVISNKYFKTR